MKSKTIKNSVKRIVALFLALMMCFTATITPLAAEKEPPKKIRISCNFNDFLKTDKNGDCTGFLANYLTKLAQINNWEYQYVTANWTDSLKMLNKGEIDFLYTVNMTEQRLETMDFSDIPLGYTASGLFALESSKYDYEDYEAMNGARIAIAKGSYNELELIQFAEEHNFTYTPVYISSNDAMMKALREGRADFAVFSAANDFDDGVLVSIMDAKPVYFAVKKGNTEMLAEINYGMQKMLQVETELVAELLHKTMSGNNNSTSALTFDERSFIESGKEIKVGFHQDTEPLAYINSNGEYAGVYVELMENIKKQSGLNIVLYPISRDLNWKDLVKDGTIDFCIGTSEVIVSKDDDLRSTDKIIEYTNIIVTKNTTSFASIKNPVIAITSSRANWVSYIKNAVGENTEIKYYKSGRECMMAVIKGDVDASFINNIEFNYNSKNDRMATLIQWPQYRFPTGVVLSARSDIDEVEFSTMNKAIGMLNTSYVDGVIDKYNGMPYESYSPSDLFYNARIPLIAVAVLLVFVSVVISMAIRFRRKQEDIKREARIREHNQLQVLAALSRNNVAVYYTDLDNDTCELLQFSQESVSRIPKQTTHSGAMREFIDNFVIPEYKDILLPFVDPKEIIKRFETDKDFSVRYQVPPKDGVNGYFEMHFVDIASNENEHKMVFGVRCINDTIKEEQIRQKLLMDALEGANRANAAKSEFLSRMSHDIRTPMNAIIGMTTIAQTHIDEPEKVKDNLEKISSASQHLLSLINDVLDMSKIESGKLSLIEEDINLTELINNLLDILQPQIKKHNHKLNVDISDITHNNVMGDSLRIRQAFINLMGNAIKYTPDGGEINFSVKEKNVKVPSAACYEFTFADNGIGMSKETQDHIFEPFSRADNSLIGKIQGTGLGLPITRNIVQMMNGNIQVESEEGKGSTFIMTIFLKLSDIQEVEEEKRENSPALTAISSFEGKRVLVVEDNELNREIANEILEMNDLTVDNAENGKEAVDMFSASEKGYYDIILMDVQMPLMNGYEATKAIRALDRDDANEIPIIAMTANAFMEDIQTAKSAGMNEHIAKPIDFSKLSEILSKYLK